MSTLLQAVQKIESAFETVDAGVEEKRAAYNWAKKQGLDKQALGMVITARRKYGANPPEYVKTDHTVRRYLAELDALGEAALPRIRGRGKEGPK